MFPVVFLSCCIHCRPCFIHIIVCRKENNGTWIDENVFYYYFDCFLQVIIYETFCFFKKIHLLMEQNQSFRCHFLWCIVLASYKIMFHRLHRMCFTGSFEVFPCWLPPCLLGRALCCVSCALSPVPWQLEALKLAVPPVHSM